MRRLLLTLASSCALLLSPGLSQASPIVFLGEVSDVMPGSVFTVPVLVSGATGLTAFQFDLSYDASILKALEFTDLGTGFESAALADGASLTGITGFLLPGLLSGVADSMSGATGGFTGGTIVDIRFEAIAAGTSALTLSNVFLDFSELGADSIVNGSITVPEPSPLALVALGFAALAWRRLYRPG